MNRKIFNNVFTALAVLLLFTSCEELFDNEEEIYLATATGYVVNEEANSMIEGKWKLVNVGDGLEFRDGVEHVITHHTSISIISSIKDMTIKIDKDRMNKIFTFNFYSPTLIKEYIVINNHLGTSENEHSSYTYNTKERNFNVEFEIVYISENSNEYNLVEKIYVWHSGLDSPQICIYGYDYDIPEVTRIIMHLSSGAGTYYYEFVPIR